MKDKKIITLGISLDDDSKKRLEMLGELKIQEAPKSVEDFLNKSEGADILYSNGAFLFDSLPKLENVFITYPYIEIGNFDSKKLEAKGVFLANAKGCNKNSVAEWTIFMILNLLRKFSKYVNTETEYPFILLNNVENVKVVLIGKGNINMRIGELCENFNMEVDYFTRNDNLLDKVKDANLIINGLSSTPSSKNLLDETFFMSLKKGAYFISYVRQYTYDIDAMIKSLDEDILAGAGIDTDSKKLFETSNDFYQKMLKHKKILVTPHIAGVTKEDFANGDEIAIQNIESFLKGYAKNIVKKK